MIWWHVLSAIALPGCFGFPYRGGRIGRQGYGGDDGGVNVTKRGLCQPIVLKIDSVRAKVIPQPKGFCADCCKPDIKSDIRLFLYTPENPYQGIELPKFRTGFAKKAGLKSNRPTVVYIHGFLEESPDGSSDISIRKAFLKRPEMYNVIIVDWSNLSAGPWYVNAADNTRLVAKVLAEFLRVHDESGEIPIRTVHMVGFSLGAHIAGFTSKLLVGLRLTRITGLDPAFPLFSINDSKRRLCKTDADFVDVVHSNCGVFGIPISIGHVDFYPNFGHFDQPGCSVEELRKKGRFAELFSCSHGRAWEFYVESVGNPEAFPATRCRNFSNSNGSCPFSVDAYLGFNVSREARGDFYLTTKDEAPFGLKAIEQMHPK